MAVEQLAHHVYPALPKDHTGREAWKAFTDGLEDPNIKISLLIGGEKMVNKALRQALKLQAVHQDARPHKMGTKTFWGSRSSPKTMKECKANRMLKLWRARSLRG
jgi:hypothetical protein